MLSLTKNPLYAMVDTETIFLKKRVYELAVVVFDSVTCAIVDSKKWYIKESLESAIFYQIRHNKTAIFWPTRLNPLALLNESVHFDQALTDFLLMLQKHDIRSLIAHNINFDISAIYQTANLYSDTLGNNQAFLSEYSKLELSGYFVHGLPLMTAYNVPFKSKSGCMTFKADFLMPCLTNGKQNHDALGDCMNQIQLYKLTKGQYANTGTIYGNMLKHHALRHDGQKRLGDSSLD